MPGDLEQEAYHYANQLWLQHKGGCPSCWDGKYCDTGKRLITIAYNAKQRMPKSEW